MSNAFFLYLRVFVFVRFISFCIESFEAHRSERNELDLPFFIWNIWLIFNNAIHKATQCKMNGGDGESNAHPLYCTHIYINLGGMTGTQRASALIMKI